MRGHINDLLRRFIGSAIRVAGAVSNRLQLLRILCFTQIQTRLRQKYGIKAETPVLSYGPELIDSIRQKATKTSRGVTFAESSGSTAKAKQILYTRRRLFMLKLTFSDMFARACSAFQIARTSLYVFTSFETDTSLTSLLLDEQSLPNYFSTLQAPYRVQRHRAIRSLLSRYSSAAVRLWILTISNPGVLYSTNPSTISTFLDELVRDWSSSSKLIRDWHEHPQSFDRELHRIAHRLQSPNCAQRLQRIAVSDDALPLSVCAPAVAAYVCWTGGYVKPFLDRLEKHLPPSRYRLIPMYSMSTETIETLPCFQGDDVAFFPMSAGVLYEFIEEDHADHLLTPQQLEPGKLYAMIVSDGYGLRRYQTDDLFLCRRKRFGLPDLIFVRRRSLEYSFTGEKLTADQLTAVFAKLRALYPALVGDGFLTCVPSHSAHTLPHYQLVLIGDRPAGVAMNDLFARHCDELLSELNCEYRIKRSSGRLGPVTFINTGIKDFTARFGQDHNWETQFKFLPLSRHT